MTARKAVKRQHKLERETHQKSLERTQLRNRIIGLGVSAIAIAAGIALAVTFISGLGSSSDADAALPVASINIGDNFFDPDTLTVRTGQKYKLNVWNQGQAIHDIWFAGSDNQSSTGDDVRSDPISPGERATVKIRYDNPGEYFFVCTFHAGQGGKLIVE